jgi:hypothetical protein
MNSNWDAVTASFVPVYGFDVVIETGEGSVLSDPAGVDCGGDCRGDFAEGTEVTLTAVPDQGWNFALWEGTCSGGISHYPSCTLEMFDDLPPVHAIFEPDAFVVDVVIDIGDGSVLSDPAGIDCPVDCSGDFESYTEVTLTAVPALGSGFLTWDGLCSGSSPTCTLFLFSQLSLVHASFTPIIP